MVNCFLINEGGLDINGDEVIGVAVETIFKFTKPIAYPQSIDAGLRVGKLSNSSVRYEIEIFLKDHNETAASGYFFHVFVDRATNAPMPIPAAIRETLSGILAVS